MRRRADRYSIFESELRGLIRQYGIDTDTRTPDFALASLLMRALYAYSEALDIRDSTTGTTDGR